VSGGVERHEKAALHHERAAESHDRAARFWADQDDAERAELQRAMAEYERLGAQLERRWGELVAPGAVRGVSHAAERTLAETREGARRLSVTLSATAEALEKSAVLAEAHALRGEQDGRPGDAAEERNAAQRARDAGHRARSQAEEWLRLIENEQR
jgi:hypothetical protein